MVKPFLETALPDGAPPMPGDFGVADGLPQADGCDFEVVPRRGGLEECADEDRRHEMVGIGEDDELMHGE